jgi:hypothetical protein
VPRALGAVQGKLASLGAGVPLDSSYVPRRVAEMAWAIEESTPLPAPPQTLDIDETTKSLLAVVNVASRFRYAYQAGPP